MRSRIFIPPRSPRRVSLRLPTLLLGLLCGSSVAFAGTIDTALLERPWPRQHVRTFEVGRHDVRWREAANRKDGILAGLNFTAPLARPRVWEMANDYTDVGRMTPGIEAVRFLENTPTRQVIQLDVKILWKRIRLTFEVEQDPPKTIRFRLVHQGFGDFRGLCVFAEAPPAPAGATTMAQTSVELDTWFQPARPVPVGLLLLVERMSLLHSMKEFLVTCDRQAASPPRGSDTTSSRTPIGRP